MRFKLRLALALGCTIAELDARMSMQEFKLWVEFYQKEPFGDRRADLQAASLAAVMANCHSAKRSFKTSDFVPDWDRAFREPPTEDELKMKMMRFAAAFGGVK